MSVSPARAAAFDILLRVERERAFATELLHSPRFGQLSPVDHGLATELVMGVLRWRSWLDQRLAEASSQELERLDAEVLAALRLGIYQLSFLSRVPARAAIFESVELVKSARKRSAAPFVNAVLRKVALNAASASPGAEAFVAIQNAIDATELARFSAHPEWLVSRWVQLFGIDTARRICAHNQHAPRTSIHIYDDQVHDNRCLDELEQSGIRLGPPLLISSARTVLSGDITQTAAYRQGRVAIQDEASHLVALLVGQGQTILDCCAAPGGKTALLAHCNPGSLVVASEIHTHRARLLRDRVRDPNVRIVAADARALPFTRTFDRILADVPCSGTGTLSRNPEIKWRLQAADLGDLQSRQIPILKSALQQLSTGGRLVYSTCSIEPEENYKVVQSVLDESPEFSLIPCREELQRLVQSSELVAPDIESLLDGPYLRTLPGVLPCDGFFAAIIEKK
jgi:16S rRNA (cytosine967-C5)-methyltransferase